MCRQPEGDETETGDILKASLSTRVRLRVIHNTQLESHYLIETLHHNSTKSLTANTHRKIGPQAHIVVSR